MWIESQDGKALFNTSLIAEIYIESGNIIYATLINGERRALGTFRQKSVAMQEFKNLLDAFYYGKTYFCVGNG